MSSEVESFSGGRYESFSRTRSDEFPKISDSEDDVEIVELPNSNDARSLNGRVTPLSEDGSKSDLISSDEKPPIAQQTETQEPSSGRSMASIARTILFVGLAVIGVIAVIFLLAYPPTTAFALVGLLGVYYGAVIGAVVTMPGLDGSGVSPFSQNNSEKPNLSKDIDNEQESVANNLNELRSSEESSQQQKPVDLGKELDGDILADEVVDDEIERSSLSQSNVEEEKAEGLFQWFSSMGAKLRERWNKRDVEVDSSSGTMTDEDSDIESGVSSFGRASFDLEADEKSLTIEGSASNPNVPPEDEASEFVDPDSDSDFSDIPVSPLVQRKSEDASKKGSTRSRIAGFFSNFFSKKEEEKLPDDDLVNSLGSSVGRDKYTSSFVIAPTKNSEGSKGEVEEVEEVEFVEGKFVVEELDSSSESLDSEGKEEEVSSEVRPPYVSAQVIPPSPPSRKYIPARPYDESVSSGSSIESSKRPPKQTFNDFFSSVRTSDDIDLEGDALLRKLDGTAQTVSETQRKLDEMQRDKDKAVEEKRSDEWQRRVDEISADLESAKQESDRASRAYLNYKEAGRKELKKPLLSLFG